MLLISMIFIITSCSQSQTFEIGESMNKINGRYKPYFSINTLYAYKVDDLYVITIFNNGCLDKMVEFSPNRECIRMQKVKPINYNNINSLLNLNFQQLKDLLGEPHTDIGSGFYIPAYITNDAYLIYFSLEDMSVRSITKCDLLTGNVIERAD